MGTKACASKDGAGSVYPSVPPQAVRHGLAEREHAPRWQRPPLCAVQACDHSRQPAVVCSAGLAWPGPGLAAHLLLLHLANVCRRVNRHLIGRIRLIGQARCARVIGAGHAVALSLSLLHTRSMEQCGDSLRPKRRLRRTRGISAAFRNLTPQTHSATAAAAGECDQATATAVPPQPCSDETQHATNSLQEATCGAQTYNNMQQTAYRKQHAVHKHTTSAQLVPPDVHHASSVHAMHMASVLAATTSPLGLKPTRHYGTQATVPVTSWLLPRSSRRLRRPALRLRLRLRLRQAKRPMTVRGKATHIRRSPTCDAPPLRPQLPQTAGSPLPHLYRDCARRCHICTGTGARRCHICTGTALAAATSAPGLD
jgi:hypothetical protein